MLANRWKRCAPGAVQVDSSTEWPPHPNPLPLGRGEGEHPSPQVELRRLPLPRRGGEGRGEGATGCYCPEHVLPYFALAWALANSASSSGTRIGRCNPDPSGSP